MSAPPLISSIVIAIVNAAEAAGEPYRLNQLADAHGMHKRNFTTHVARLRREGKLPRPQHQACVRMGETQKRAEKHGTMEPCITCRETFLSEGKHNRMCDRCRGLSVSPFAPDVCMAQRRSPHGRGASA